MISASAINQYLINIQHCVNISFSWNQVLHGRHYFNILECFFIYVYIYIEDNEAKRFLLFFKRIQYDISKVRKENRTNARKER